MRADRRFSDLVRTDKLIARARVLKTQRDELEHAMLKAELANDRRGFARLARKAETLSRHLRTTVTRARQSLRLSRYATIRGIR